MITCKNGKKLIGIFNVNFNAYYDNVTRMINDYTDFSFKINFNSSATETNYSIVYNTVDENGNYNEKEIIGYSGNKTIIRIEENNMPIYGDHILKIYVPVDVNVVNYDFYGSKTLSDVHYLDLTHVSSIKGIFKDCWYLKTISNFIIDTKNKIENTSYAFYNCKSLEYIERLILPYCKNAAQMFYGCLKLQYIDYLDLSMNRNGYNLFKSCEQLLRIGTFIDNDLKIIDGMFDGCTLLKEFPYFNTSSAVSAVATFRNCVSATEIPLYDLGKCTKTDYMLYGCESLSELPVFNLERTVSANYMCAEMTSLINMPAFNTSSLVYSEGMYENCININPLN